MPSKRIPYIAAGAAAGVVGLLVFLTIHHFTINPIWMIMPVGVVLAAAGGAAVGWAFYEMRPRLGQNALLAALILAGLLTLTQVPGFLIGQRHGPVVDIQSESILEGMTSEIIRRFVFDLVIMAGVMGALIGWFVGRTRTAAAAMALAGIAFALGPGHNIPFFVGVGLGAAAKMLWIMAAVIIASGLTMGVITYWFENR